MKAYGCTICMRNVPSSLTEHETENLSHMGFGAMPTGTYVSHHPVLLGL